MTEYDVDIDEVVDLIRSAERQKAVGLFLNALRIAHSNGVLAGTRSMAAAQDAIFDTLGLSMRPAVGGKQ